MLPSPVSRSRTARLFQGTIEAEFASRRMVVDDSGNMGISMSVCAPVCAGRSTIR